MDRIYSWHPHFGRCHISICASCGSSSPATCDCGEKRSRARPWVRVDSRLPTLGWARICLDAGAMGTPSAPTRSLDSQQVGETRESLGVQRGPLAIIPKFTADPWGRQAPGGYVLNAWQTGQHIGQTALASGDGGRVQAPVKRCGGKVRLRKSGPATNPRSRSVQTLVLGPDWDALW